MCDRPACDSAGMAMGVAPDLAPQVETQDLGEVPLKFPNQTKATCLRSSVSTCFAIFRNFSL